MRHSFLFIFQNVDHISSSGGFVSDLTADRAFSEGQNLLAQLILPVKDASGKDVTPNNKPHIEHVERMLEELQKRKIRCDELADVRKLKLQQILQLRTCERDAEQVKKNQVIQ